MKIRLSFLLCAMAATTVQFAFSQGMSVPKTVEAGKAFSIQSTGSGKASLYVIGLGQALKRDVQLGEVITFPLGSLCNAGRYLAVLADDASTQSEQFDVIAENRPAEVSFLAKPSRLPVGLHDGITGAVYVFDAYYNLIFTPTPVSFELSSPAGTVQRRTVETRFGAAWTTMDSTPQQGIDKFVARAGSISSTRVVGQVPGDPCGLKMSAGQLDQQLQLQTEPVKDCNGNAVPDGTIVTFTESFDGVQSTVDVPLKHGVAQVQMAMHDGATISVASGVVLGNQIRWKK